MKKKNVVVIGGGTGTYTVLSGLKKHPVHLSAVVAMADNGGSTKVLREESHILPPGSVRPALIALSATESTTLSNLFNFRFNEPSLHGHNFGNLFISALTQQEGSFEKAIEKAEEILNAKGHVIPSTLVDCNLVAKLENGKIIKGEEAIDEPKHDGNLRVEKVWLEPKGKCKANPKALKAIKEADLIVLGPGDLFTSILPNLLTPELAEARRFIQRTKAKKVYVCNLMTKFGETNGYTALDFVDKLEEYLGKGILDYVLVNTKKPGISRIRKYEKEYAEFVKYNKKDFEKRAKEIYPYKSYKVIAKDFLRKEGFVRHDSAKLARALIALL